MPRIDVYNTNGKKVGQVSLPEAIFAAKINENLIAQAVKVYLANQRHAHAKVKTRAEVAGSGRKIYRQKGTGRARHGDAYAPIFVGGGGAHGPKGIENYQLKMPKKMRRQALFASLTAKLKEKQIIIIDGLEKVKPKTKEMVKILKNLKLAIKNGHLDEKILLVLPQSLENILQASRNLRHLQSTPVNLLNTYQVLNGGKLLILKPAIKVLKETFLGRKT